MLKLFDLKKPGANNGGAGASSPRTGPSAAYLRLQKGECSMYIYVHPMYIECTLYMLCKYNLIYIHNFYIL